MGVTLLQQRQSTVVNVLDYAGGLIPDGNTLFDAAITAANNASTSGSRIWFPSGTYLVSSAVKLLQNRSYHGAAYGATAIKQANGANLDSILASAGYLNNNVTVDVAVDVENLFIDGNWNNNTSGNGLTLMNSFAIVRQVWCNNIANNGIVFSDRSIANISTTITQAINSTGSQTVSVGSTTGMSQGMSLSVDPTGGNAEAITVTAVVDSTHITANFTKTHTNGVTLSSFLMNSSIENRILDCKVANANSSGIWVRDNTVNPGRCTDNHILNNVLSNCGATGNVPTMFVERSAGHFIHRNHLYACQASGITCNNAWSTFITENEIDGYGQNVVPSGQFWKGISVTCIGPRAAVISDNIISTGEPNASTVYQHLSVTAGGSTTGRALIHDNHVYGGGGNAAHSIGLLVQSNGTQTGSGQSFFFLVHGNRMENVGAPLFYDNAATSILSGNENFGDVQLDAHLTASLNILAAPALAALANNGGSAPAPASSLTTCQDTRGRVRFGSGTSPSAGAQVSVTFAKAYASTPTIVLIASNAATAALNPYVDSPSTTGFNIALGTAPAASQASTTYIVGYIVIG